jgi:hypothetical protein
MAETKTPTLHWAQREQKVLIEFQTLNTKDAKVTLSEGLLSLECAVDATAYKLENLPLFAEIDEEESKWFRDDRKIAISLKKKAPEWWDTLSKDKSFKKFIKTDFSKWCEDDDKEYTGDLGPEGDGMDFGGMGGMGGMPGMGGMGGMDLSAMMGGMGGMGGMPGMGEFDDDDDDGEAGLDDLNPPALEGDDGPPPLEGDGVKPEEMEEVD